MAEECVGFHSYFWQVQAKWGSKTPLRLAIINEFRSTQPTTLWDLYRSTERLAKAIEILLAIRSLDPR